MILGGRSRSDSGSKGDPLFHVVPPKPQRLLHSEAYIKYIEGLSRENKTMCNWDKQLTATNEVISKYLYIHTSYFLKRKNG